jgi:hypothetical protein
MSAKNDPAKLGRENLPAAGRFFAHEKNKSCSTYGTILELREIEFGIYGQGTGTTNCAVWQSVGHNPMKILSPIFLQC